MGQTCIGDRKTLKLTSKAAIINRKSIIWLRMTNVWQNSHIKHATRSYVSSLKSIPLFLVAIRDFSSIFAFGLLHTKVFQACLCVKIIQHIPNPIQILMKFHNLPAGFSSKLRPWSIVVGLWENVEVQGAKLLRVRVDAYKGAATINVMMQYTCQLNHRLDCPTIWYINLYPELHTGHRPCQAMYRDRGFPWHNDSKEWKIRGNCSTR